MPKILILGRKAIYLFQILHDSSDHIPTAALSHIIPIKKDGLKYLYLQVNIFAELQQLFRNILLFLLSHSLLLGLEDTPSKETVLISHIGLASRTEVWYPLFLIYLLFTYTIHLQHNKSIVYVAQCKAALFVCV